MSNPSDQRAHAQERARNRVSRRGLQMLAAAVLAAAYALLRYALPTLTGDLRLDAFLGVVLGLYVCSLPAANLLDLLFFGRQAMPHSRPVRSLHVWIGLNLILLLLGWTDIFLGATQLASRAG